MEPPSRRLYRVVRRAHESAHGALLTKERAAVTIVVRPVTLERAAVTIVVRPVTLSGGIVTQGACYIFSDVHELRALVTK